MKTQNCLGGLASDASVPHFSEPVMPRFTLQFLALSGSCIISDVTQVFCYQALPNLFALLKTVINNTNHSTSSIPFCLLLSVLDRNCQAKARATGQLRIQLLFASRGDSKCLKQDKVPHPLSLRECPYQDMVGTSWWGLLQPQTPGGEWRGDHVLLSAHLQPQPWLLWEQGWQGEVLASQPYLDSA